MRTIFFIALFCFPTLTFAALFEAQANGSWHDPATWGTASSIPGAADSVIIDGFNVDINSGTVNILNLLLTLDKGSGNSLLNLKTNTVLNISQDLTVETNNVLADVILNLTNSTKLNVSGNMIMDRKATNSNAQKLLLKMEDSSETDISGSFKYFYRSSLLEFGYEVELKDNAQFTVNQLTQLSASGGQTLVFIAYDSAIVQLLGGLRMNQTSGSKAIWFSVGGSANVTIDNAAILENDGGSDKMVLSILGGTITISDSLKLIAQNGSKVDVDVIGASATLDLDGDMIFNADNDDLAEVDVFTNANFHLAGTIERADLYGDFNGKFGGVLHLDGTVEQIIPGSSGAGNDSLNLGEVVFSNSAGIRLTEDFLIKDTMILSQGIIYSADTAILILEDGVGISSGSENNYVDGPMIKRGSTNGSDFIFPLGNNGIYAPIQISAITNSTTSYKSRYTGCPPPVGTVNSPLNHVLQTGYWELERLDGGAMGDVTLHWNDADLWGINDTSKLVVSTYDMGTGWTGLGRFNANGNVGPGASGYISNDTGCPPPVGNTVFGFASTDAFVNLPVELISFHATKNQRENIVYLNWETTSENNSSNFIVQKSADGFNFENIINIPAAGNSSTLRRYETFDEEPEPGNNYYRIVMIDLDGMMRFSKLRNVFFQGKNDAPIVYPNPVNDRLNIYSSELNDRKILIQIFDNVGKRLYINNHQAFDGQLSFNIGNLPLQTGNLYHITYTLNGIMHAITFQKIKQ